MWKTLFSLIFQHNITAAKKQKKSKKNIYTNTTRYYDDTMMMMGIEGWEKYEKTTTQFKHWLKLKIQCNDLWMTLENSVTLENLPIKC